MSPLLTAVFAVLFTSSFLILVRYGAPLALRRFFPRLGIASVSPRSIRGLVWHGRSFILSVERIGFGLHRPSLERSSWVSVQVENFELQFISDPSGRSLTNKTLQGSLSSYQNATRTIQRPQLSSSLADILDVDEGYGPPAPYLDWILPLSFIQFLDRRLRPILRVLFVHILRTVFRALPSVTQVVQFEMDSAAVTSTSLDGAGFSLAEVRVNGCMELKHMGEIGEEDAESVSSVGDGRSGASKLRARMQSGMSRLWNRAWGNANGLASLKFEVGTLKVFCGVSSTSSSQEPSDSPSDRPISLYPDERTKLSQPFVPAETVFLTKDALTIRLSVRLEPRKGLIDNGSLDIDVEVPPSSVSLGAVVKLGEALKTVALSEDDLSPPPGNSADADVRRWSSGFRRSISHRPIARRRFLGKESRKQKAREESPLQMLVHVISKINLRLHALDIDLDVLSTGDMCLSLTVQEVAGQVVRSDPAHNKTHRDWLGNRNDTSGSSPIAASIHVKVITLRRLGASGFSDEDVIAVGDTDLNSLWTGIPGQLTSHDLFGWDENAFLCILEATVQSVDIRDNAETLRQMSSSFTNASSVSPPSRRKSLHCLPRLVASLDIQRILLRVDLSDRSQSNPLHFDVRNDGVTLHVVTSYVDLCTSTARYEPGKAYWGGEDGRRLHSDDDSYSLRYEFSVEGFVAPVSGQIRLPAVQKLRSEPIQLVEIFRVGRCDLDVVGHILGMTAPEHPRGVSVLDPRSLMADVRVIVESAVLEAWDPAMLAVLREVRVAASPPSVSSQVGQTFVRPSFWSRLPSGVCLYMSVLSCLMQIGGEDPTSHLSRGLAAQMGFVAQYCYYQSLQHTIRTKKRLGLSLARQRLSLPEDLSAEAAAVANDTESVDDRAALASLTAWNMSVKSFLNAEEGREYISSPGSPVGQAGCEENVICSIPRLVGRALVRGHGRDGKSGAESSCDLTIEVPAISAHVRLLHLFCVLLAVRSAECFLSIPQGTPTTSMGLIHIAIRVVASMETVDISCSLPSNARLYIRISRFQGEWAPRRSVHLRWASAYVWTPSPTVDGAWEEFLRLREWSISVAVPGQAVFVAAAKGARIHIPYKYILYELVSDLVVLVKTSGHLARCIKQQVFTSPPFPSPKPSRVMPHIELHIDTFTMEAVDAPFESRLNLIWRTGYQEQLARLDRDLAFQAKVEAIGGRYSSRPTSRASHQPTMAWNFSEKHAISAKEAYQRLQMYNAQSWVKKYNNARMKQERNEDIVHRTIHGTPFHFGPYRLPIVIHTPDKSAPLIRIMLTGVDLTLTRPSFQASELPRFVNDLGQGVPMDHQYTLLLPMGVSWKMVTARITLRDYPLPLFQVPENGLPGEATWSLSSDLVIAEQVGPPTSIQWIRTEVVPDGTGRDGSPGLYFEIPKTCMPIKTYAEPHIQICTSSATEFAWGVSYNPAIHDVMRVIESITSPPRDPSPPVGFWDKLRLVLHWRVKWDFTKAGVHFHIKGSRDPYNVADVGAGFALCWEGCPSIRIGYSDKDMELIQVQSERMSFVIPNLDDLDGHLTSGIEPGASQGHPQTRSRLRKMCAKFTNGVQWGIGFKVERTCRPEECSRCKGSIFHRQCRLFDFRPHYTVELKSPPSVARPPEGWPDSYAGFRSDFLHMSLSLTSPTRDIHQVNSRGNATLPGYNNLHLTPKGFAHFWSWWRLFDGTMSIPIRQGKLFPSVRPPSPKFGRHLATIKYRVSLAPLIISHGYRQDSMAQWAKGITGAVGIKAMINGFRADMHQRLQEMVTYHEKLQRTKRTARKVFSAADVTLLDVDLRTLSAVFTEPEKTSVADEVDSDSEEIPCQCTVACDDIAPGWFDLDDFVDADWTPSDQKPKIRLLNAGACPRFSFFKRANAHSLSRPSSDQLLSQDVEVTKFGDEDTHICFAGQEDDAYQVQIELASRRLAELESELAHLSESYPPNTRSERQDRVKMSEPAAGMEREADLLMKAGLLREYISRLQGAEERAHANGGLSHSFFEHEPLRQQGTSPDVFLEDWMNFDNVYEAHFPTLFLSNDTRNALLDYYYSSRVQRGLEYHMSERSVKFIRDHAKPVHASEAPPQSARAASQPAPASAGQDSRPHGTAQGLFRLFAHEDRGSDEGSKDQGQRVGTVFEDPHSGWSDDVTIRKSHIARLIKPQIVLRSDINQDSTAVVAIRSVSIRNFSVLDKDHLDDPVNGHIMQRNYVSLHGLQMFCPSQHYVASSIEANIFVPLEVLLDIRCETTDFDRLVPYTDAGIHYDKFNQLRLRKNMRTGSLDSLSRRNEHLKHNMDRMIISIPVLSVSADARHFSAMYNIVTDLLLYRDPTQKARSQTLETFLYSYDFTDLSSAVEVISGIQTRMRQLLQLERDAALGNAHDPGLRGQLAIRAQMQSLAEELSLIFDAIKLKQDKTGTRRDQEESSALRVEICASEISWMMLDPTHALLAKLSVKGIAFSWLNRKDGSASSKLDLEDLQVLNSAPDALFPEMLVKYEKASNHPMVKMSRFGSASWSVLAPVSGIPIIESFELELHPVRLQIERRVGRQLMDYVFSRRRKEVVPQQSADIQGSTYIQGVTTNTTATIPFLPVRQQSSVPRQSDRVVDDTGRVYRPRLLPGRASSMTDMPGSGALNRQRALPRVASSDRLASRSGNSDNKDAMEMRNRAAQNRTFLEINVASSVFVLSYKGDKAKSITDLYDFKFQVPAFQYRNQIWSFEDLVQQLKKDIIRSAWQQKGALFREVVTKRRRPRHLLQEQARQDSSGSHRSHSSLEVRPSNPASGKKTGTSRLWPIRRKGRKGPDDVHLQKVSSRRSPTAPSSPTPAQIYQEGSMLDTTEGRWTGDAGTLVRSPSPEPIESDSDGSGVEFPTDDDASESSVEAQHGGRPPRRRTVSDYPELYST